MDLSGVLNSLIATGLWTLLAWLVVSIRKKMKVSDQLHSEMREIVAETMRLGTDVSSKLSAQMAAQVLLNLYRKQADDRRLDRIEITLLLLVFAVATPEVYSKLLIAIITCALIIQGTYSQKRLEKRYIDYVQSIHGAALEGFRPTGQADPDENQ